MPNFLYHLINQYGGVVPWGSYFDEKQQYKRPESQRLGKGRRGAEAEGSCQTILPQFLIFHPASPSAGVEDPFPPTSSFALYPSSSPPIFFGAGLVLKLGGSPYLLTHRLRAHGKRTESPETPAGQEPAF